MLNRFLDWLSGRVGLSVACAALLFLSLIAAGYFHVSATQLEAYQKEFNEGRLRNGFMAIGDIHRAANIVHRMTLSGGPTAAQHERFAAAMDMLYVRAESFPVAESFQEKAHDEVQGVIKALNVLVSIGDQAITDDYRDFDTFVASFVDASDSARAVVLAYIDSVRRFEREVFSRQSDSLVQQTTVLWSILAALTITGFAFLFLLRREVLIRRAKERAEMRAHQLAFFDPVTGLPNRVQFQDRVEALLKPGFKGALVLIDLDGFKDINDTHGHVVGDDVLRCIGGRIRHAAETNRGFAARLGGDEFAVFLKTDNTRVLRAFCAQLLEDCGQPIHAGSARLVPSISIGLAATSQMSAVRAPRYDDLIRVTDFALYASKGAGRGRFTLYDSDLERNYQERRKLLEALPGAIAKGELEVFLQPKVALDTGTVLGFEALVRWYRDGEYLSPASFIQIAEECGLVIDIDICVLDRAVAQVAEWNRRNGTDFSVSVNLSGLHFSGAASLDFVGEALARNGLRPEKLTLEITETVQLANWDQVGQAVAGLRQLGCRISIDDFGTGYSSLAYLRTINADELKIDKSLIDEIETSEEAQFILDAVLELAESLGLSVVVEGIERQGQCRFLQKIGCKRGQGYLFDRPRPAADALAAATLANAGHAGLQTA